MPSEFFTPEQRRNLLLSVGTHRGARALSPVEVGEHYKEALSLGATKADCASASQLEGTTWVSRFLRLLELPIEVRHLVDWGKTEEASIGFTAATELSRLKVTSDQEAVAKAALEHLLSSAEVRQIVQLRLRSGKPIEECIAGGLRMRPEIEIRHVFFGSILNDKVRAKLGTMLQSARNAAVNRILADKFPDLKATGRLAGDRFTLVGRDELGARVRQGEKLEAEINRELEGLLHA